MPNITITVPSKYRGQGTAKNRRDERKKKGMKLFYWKNKAGKNRRRYVQYSRADIKHFLQAANNKSVSRHFYVRARYVRPKKH